LPANPDVAWQQIDDPQAVALSIRGTVATSEGITFLDEKTGTTEDVTFALIKSKYDPQATTARRSSSA
jgi:hypothetical protein